MKLLRDPFWWSMLAMIPVALIGAFLGRSSTVLFGLGLGLAVILAGIVGYYSFRGFREE